MFSSVKVILKQKDGNVFNYIECSEKCEKLELETQHITDEKSRRNSLADENVVILQLLKKNNLENDEEAMKKVKDFLLNSTWNIIKKLLLDSFSKFLGWTLDGWS